MRKNTLKKAMAVMISATMLVTGYTVVSAEGFTDAEALAEMDALLQVMKLYMWKKFSRKLHRLRRFSQSRLRQRFSRRLHRPRKFGQKNLGMSSRPGNLLKKPLFVDGFTDSSAEADPAEFTDGTGEVGDAVETTVDSDFRFENEEVIITAKVFDETTLPENAEMNAVKLEAGSEKYEEAKQASIRDLGTTEDDEYTFYDVTFIADGVEIEVPDEAVVINMEFKKCCIRGKRNPERPPHPGDRSWRRLPRT